jgi:hypothetical protein
MKLELKTSYRDVELMEAPGLAVVDMTPHLIKRVQAFCNAIKRLECYQITEFDYSPWWTTWAEDDEGNDVPGEELRVECCLLVVTEHYFKWKCYVKHTDVELVTDEVPIDKFPKVTSAFPEHEEL